MIARRRQIGAARLRIGASRKKRDQTKMFREQGEKVQRTLLPFERTSTALYIHGCASVLIGTQPVLVVMEIRKKMGSLVGSVRDEAVCRGSQRCGEKERHWAHNYESRVHSRERIGSLRAFVALSNVGQAKYRSLGHIWRKGTATVGY